MGVITNKNSISGAVKATELVSHLLSHGISVATTEDLSHLLQVHQNHVRQRMAPLLKRGEMISPARGLWVPVPYEYRMWGAPEAIYFINQMMKYLGADYYVGWMSAAAILGASHHAPQVFQVATSRAIANRVVGRSDIKFYMRSNVSSLPTYLHKTQTGTVNVSTRAATMLSITCDLSLASGLNNAANIIIELSETDESFVGELADCACLFPISALRRLGWILENFANTGELGQLSEISQKHPSTLSKLSTYKAYNNKVDKKWSLDINERIEPDV